MKKFILLFGFVFGIANIFAQSLVKGNGIEKEIERNFSGYDAVKLKGSFDVILTNEKQNKVRIVGEENIIPFVEIVLNGKELELSFKPKSNLSYKKLIVYVPAKDVNKVHLIGSGDIENNDKFSGNKLDIILNGSGDIILKDLKFNKINVLLNGSGDVELKGKTTEFIAQLRGSGEISAYGLNAEIADVELKGSGDVKVYSTKEFLGKLSGSGDINVKGNPSKVTQNRKGSGYIKLK